MSEAYAIKEALESDETKATLIRAILESKYGQDVFNWDPLTVSMEVNADFGAEMSSQNGSRWCALQTAMTSDAFFVKLEAFMAVCNALATGDGSFGVFDPVSVEEAGWGIAEVALNRDMLPFSDTIKNYLRLILDQGGLSKDYPAVFDNVFDDRPEQINDAVREARTNPNKDSMEEYLDEELGDVIYQFSKIPSLVPALDKILYHDGTLTDAL